MAPVAIIIIKSEISDENVIMTEEIKNKDMEKDLQAIREVNQVILERLNGVLDQGDYVCNCECHRKDDNAAIKTLSQRLAELEENDRKRKDDIEAIERELENCKESLASLTVDSDKPLVKQSERQTEKQTDSGEEAEEVEEGKNDTGNDVIVGSKCEDPNVVQKENQKSLLDDAEQSLSINNQIEGIVNVDTLESDKLTDGNILKQLSSDISEQTDVSKDGVVISTESPSADSSGSVNATETKDPIVRPKTDMRKIFKPNFQTKSHPQEQDKFKKQGKQKKGYTPLQTWRNMGELEEREGGKSEVKYLDGVHTVLLVDISESMVDVWSEVKTFVYLYLEGLENLATEQNFKEENVALVTFGHSTAVQVRLTKDLKKVRQAFDSLTLGGPTPLFGGIIMAVAAAQSNSKKYEVSGIDIPKRVVLISDGHFTEAELSSGPDEVEKSKLEETTAQILGILKQFPESGKELICVPVGKANMDLFEQATSRTCGRKISCTDGRKLAREFYLIKQSLQPDVDHFGGLGALGSCLRIFLHSKAKLDPMGDLNGPRKELQKQSLQLGSVHLVGKGALGGLLEIGLGGKGEHQGSLTGLRKKLQYLESDSERLPKIGSRVRRGPDWTWNNQDNEGPGTVIGHDEQDVKVWVQWDADERRHVYYYGRAGCYDVLLVDEPRIIDKNDNIKVGCMVKPGELWKYDYRCVKQHEEGIVIRVHHKRKNKSKIQVKWAEGYRGDYSYNPDGPSEVKLVLPHFSDEPQRTDQPTVKKTGNKNKYFIR